MQKALSLAIAVCLSLVPVLSSPLGAEEKKPATPPSLKVGDMAPDFKLHYFDGAGLKEVTLGEYRGKKNVVLAFYVFAFTGG
jgi:hypothetical protein